MATSHLVPFSEPPAPGITHCWSRTAGVACRVLAASNDEAIANNHKTGNNGKFAHGYQWAQWTWDPGHEGVRGSFDSCGYARAKKWAADYKYEQHVASFPSGAIGSRQTCVDNSPCDCDCQSMLATHIQVDSTSTAVTTMPGSVLFLDPARATPNGPPIFASIELNAIDLANNATVAQGTIRLDYDTSMTGPRLGKTGVFQNSNVVVVPLPGGGFAVDLANITLQFPFGAATHALSLGGAVSGSEGDDGYFEPYGTACPGFGGFVPVLGASGVPNFGNTYILDLTASPVTAFAVLALGQSNTAWNGLPLPLRLDLLGAAGCSLHTAVDVTLPIAFQTPGQGSLPIAVPNDPALAGVALYHQGAVFDPAANALGLVTTNGLTARLGGTR